MISDNIHSIHSFLLKHPLVRRHGYDVQRARADSRFVGASSGRTGRDEGRDLGSGSGPRHPIRSIGGSAIYGRSV